VAGALGAEDGGETVAVSFAKEGATLSALKVTEKGPPTEPTDVLGYLDHFVLDVRLQRARGAAPDAPKIAAWFGRAAKDQIKATFAKDDDRGTPYEIRDDDAQVVPPEHPDAATAIPFHAEFSNKTAKRASLSKGVGGDSIPLVPAGAGVTRLYSSMHQRFSYSLAGLEEKHFREFGARYSLEQLSKFKPGRYHLVLPFTVVIVDGSGRVLVAQHCRRTLTLDLTEKKREETIESFKGSGAPRMTLEPARANVP
jgi:hypothetical protein